MKEIYFLNIKWLGTLAVELGQPVTAQITALVLFQEKPSLAHYKLLKERGVPAEKIEFLLMKVSKSTKDIGILEVLLQKLYVLDALTSDLEGCGMMHLLLWIDLSAIQRLSNIYSKNWKQVAITTITRALQS